MAGVVCGVEPMAHRAALRPGGAKVIWVGLDYGAARAALDLAGLTVTPETWADVRAIEGGAIEELNRRG